MGWGEYTDRDARIDASIRARAAEDAARTAETNARRTAAGILEDARSRRPGDEKGQIPFVARAIARGDHSPRVVELLEHELERLRKAASDRELRELRSEALELDTKEQSLVSRSSSPALSAGEFRAAIEAALGVNWEVARTGYTEIYTRTSGVVYMTTPEPGQPVDPAGLSCPAPASSHAGQSWEKFLAALPMGGLKREGLPTGKALSEVAAETAKRLGGEMVEEQPMEGLFLLCVTLPDGGRVTFSAGARPASQRPWLRGGRVAVQGGCFGETPQHPTLADLWKSATR